MTLEDIITLASKYEIDKTPIEFRKHLSDPSIWKTKAEDVSRDMFRRIWDIMLWVGISAVDIADAVGFNWKEHENEWVRNWNNHDFVVNSKPISVL